MRSFQIAAEQETEVEEILEFSVAGEEFKVKLPSASQATLVIANMSRGASSAIAGVYRFLERALLDDGYERLTNLISEGELPFEVLFGGDELNEIGIVEWIVQEAAARPTKPLSGSQRSSKSSGKRSTGRSPGKGSTHSS